MIKDAKMLGVNANFLAISDFFLLNKLFCITKKEINKNVR